MKIAIMQPYFLPYIGYWQLISSVDKFVVYDNIKYTKKGWINRNRYLQNGKDAEFTIPIKKDSDFLNVVDRYIAGDFNKSKLLNKISESYRKAPCYSTTIELFKKILNYSEQNLFNYIYHSILEICKYLEITTEIIISSKIDTNHNLKSQEKVIAICKSLSASVYINAIGGQDLYLRSDFQSSNIDLKFIKSGEIVYKQFKDDFIPWLSILDVMMFNKREDIIDMLGKYELI